MNHYFKIMKISRKTQLCMFIFLCSAMLSGCNRADIANQAPIAASPAISEDRIIDLSGKNLDKLPADVLKNTKTKKLILSDNRIKSLPAEIGNLSALEEFYVNGNLLEGALPAEIRKMAKLTIFDASDNNLTGIPAEIGQLKDLKVLDLSGNKIDAYPNELENLKDNLETLELSGNLFKPETISEIQRKLPKTKIGF